MKIFAGLAELRRAELGWRSVSWVLLLAFTLQSFVTETHIHTTAFPAGGVAMARSPALTNRHTAPVEDSTGACPFCQAVVHAGAFFAPASPLCPVPLLAAFHLAPVAVVGALVGVIAHDWQSRAPPQS
jgi:hypothetical protein